MSGWWLSEPNVEIRDGEMHRRYLLVVRRAGDKVRACAMLSVAMWLAPRPVQVTIELWPRVTR